MQVSPFLRAAPAPSPSAGQSGRTDGPREQAFDSVYQAEERRPQAPDAAEAPSDARRKTEPGDAEKPQPADERQRAEDSPGREIASEGEDTPVERAGAEAIAEPPAVKVAEDAQIAEGAGTADETPDEAAVAVAEAPARPTRARTPDAAEDQPPARAADARTAPPATADAETPAATKAPESAAPAQPAAPERTAPPATPEQTAAPAAPERAAHPAAAAEPAQPRTAAVPPAAEEVVVRRVRTDQPARAEAAAETADAETPRVEPRPRDAEVKAPKPVAAPAAPDAAARPPADIAAQVAADPLPVETGAAEIRSTADHAARAEATIRHETPRPVMQQVAEAARALRDGPVELTMQPEELGKVRMTLTAGPDGQMTMSLQAERSETLDLLRRHIGDLARELQDMGFSNLNFSFGQDRTSSGQDPRPAGFEGDADERPIAAVPLAGPSLAARPNMAPTSGGLDLRL